MKLLDLEPRFLIHTDASHYHHTDDIKEADGILFLCPECFKKNNGAIGTHSIICWQPHIPQTTSPTPGRWNFLGTGYHDLTLKAGSSSISITDGCKAHFFITNGEIKFT